MQPLVTTSFMNRKQTAPSRVSQIETGVLQRTTQQAKRKESNSIESGSLEKGGRVSAIGVLRPSHTVEHGQAAKKSTPMARTQPMINSILGNKPSFPLTTKAAALPQRQGKRINSAYSSAMSLKSRVAGHLAT